MELERPAFPRPKLREVDQAPDTAGLAARIGELRAQLGALAPRDEDEVARNRAAAADALAVTERVAVLERLLAGSRWREEELTAEMLREASLEADLHARITEMAGELARAGGAEALLDEAGRRGDEAERRAASLAEEARLHSRENETLRARVESLETDLNAAVGEVVASAAERVRSARLERERDESREEAEQQRRVAMEGRLRTAEAEARMKVLDQRVSSLHERLVGLIARLPAATPQPGEAVLDLRGVAHDTPAEPVVEPVVEPGGSADGGWA